MKKIITIETVMDRDVAEYIDKAIKNKETIKSVTPTGNYYYDNKGVITEYEVETQKIEN